MPTKLYVLDTSVLLYSANSIHSFGNNVVVIPYVVLEELDKFKTREDVVGTNARQVARELNDLRKKGPLNRGVQVNDLGGTLRVELNYHDPESNLLNTNQNDDRILNVCLGLKNAILVTKDVNLGVRADVLGIQSEDFDTDRTVDSVSEMYKGTLELVVPDTFIDEFYNGPTPLYFDELSEARIFPNQYLTMVSEQNAGKTALAKVLADGRLMKPKLPKSIWGITPRNREQHFAMNALLDSNIALLSLTGAAGTGKTLVSLACALHQVQDTRVYNRLVVSRPVQPMGKDIGFLPGTVDEKMAPWMGPIKDSLEFLTRGRNKNVDMYQELLSLKMLEVEPLTYIRGRSLPNTFFLIDEAQDMSRAEIKTIVSRMGENSKLVLIGDVMQISNPYLDSTNNGLSNVIEKFKPYDFAAHITLEKGERSVLASVAGEIL